MKKVFLLLSFALLSNVYFAQWDPGTPVYFCSLNGNVYNPGAHNNVPYSNYWVVTRSDREWSPEEQVFLNRSITEDYPGHTILEGPTVTYNCHGYTFGVIQGSDRYNITWSEDLSANAFVLVTTPQVGDIAVMRYTNVSQLDSPHSSLVYSQDTMISKWGDSFLTKHHKDNLIGISDQYANGQIFYTYYRRIGNSIIGQQLFDGSGT